MMIWKFSLAEPDTLIKVYQVTLCSAEFRSLDVSASAKVLKKGDVRKWESSVFM